MKFEFNLEWDELPEGFRRSKIDEVLRTRWNDGEYDKEDPEGIKDPVRPAWDEIFNNEEIRQGTENWISAHFPIYF